jgi:hypothetical protein
MIWKFALTVDDVPFWKPSESEKSNVGCLGVPHLLSPSSRLNDTRSDPLHLRFFLTNKQMYAETSPVFYSCNEFTADVMSLTHSKFNANIRRNVRRVRLETRPWQAVLQRYSPPLRDIHLSFTSHKIELLTITMPSEPPASPVLVKGENLAITPSLALDLVDCMLNGFIKRIRLLYPIPTGYFTPKQFLTEASLPLLNTWGTYSTQPGGMLTRESTPRYCTRSETLLRILSSPDSETVDLRGYRVATL